MSVDEMRSTTRQLAFDPNRFFPDAYTAPLITIRYTGDDYGYPVYSLALRRGCTKEDVGDARRSCAARMVARMVRSPDPAPEDSKPTRRRWLGAALFDYLEKRKPNDEAELRNALDAYGLEWLEADVSRCDAAMAHLSTAEDISFFADPALVDPGNLSIVLHADKIEFEFGGYITRSRYYGYAKRNSPGEWADQFVPSLDECCKPATSIAPWRLDKPPEPEGD